MPHSPAFLPFRFRHLDSGSRPPVELRPGAPRFPRFREVARPGPLPVTFVLVVITAVLAMILHNHSAHAGRSWWTIPAVLGGLAAGCATRWFLARLPRGTPIGFGVCELSTACLWAAAACGWAAGVLPTWWMPAALLVTALAVPLAIVDIRHRRLPDAFTLTAYPAIAVAVAIAAFGGGGVALAAGAALGSVAYLLLHLVVACLRPGSLGGGDVKLAGSLGAVLGAIGTPAVLLAPIGAATVTIALHLTAPHRWRDGIPYGPGLLAATCTAALVPALVSTPPW